MATASNTLDEEWRAIPGHEGYEASSLGRVRSIDRVAHVLTPKGAYERRFRGRVLTAWLAGEGYLYVSLGAGFKTSVHRVVALTFHGDPPTPEHHAAHRDGTKVHNAASNVRWATPAENARDKFDHGTAYGRTGMKGSRHHKARFTEDEIKTIRAKRTGRRGEITKLAASLGVSRSTIGLIFSGSTWSHI